MYLTRKVEIHPGHLLYDWCHETTALANNLANAVRFRQRQVLTAVKKEPKDWTANEKEIMDEIANALPAMCIVGKKEKHYKLPTETKRFLNYSFLEDLLKVTKNQDYLAKGLPKQSAQQVIKTCVRDMKAFYASMHSYQKDPSKFTDKPELPGYKRKGGHCTTPITNQDCKIIQDDKTWYAKLPYIKDKPLNIGCLDEKAALKEAKVTPNNGRYILSFVFEIPEDMPVVVQQSSRIAAVDPGVDNLMAVTNNVGLPSILIKGGIVKSINQKYNKDVAAIVSRQTAGSDKKFIPTEEYYEVTNYRNNKIQDQLLKCANFLVRWCIENRIDTLVFGKNVFWKQEVNIGKKNNQNFVQIPHAKLGFILSYLCERAGIRFVEQEESYTSKASFLDNDFIPVYGKTDQKPTFSGKRRQTRYKGMYNEKGFRGLYRASDGTIINSDLNGSANILRKAFPDAFKCCQPDFEHVEIIRNVEQYHILRNQDMQCKSGTCISKSRARRMKKVLPLG